jgi:hypothetical protein
MNLKTLFSAISTGIICLSAHAQDAYESQRALWLERAENSKPALNETVCRPQYLVHSVSDPNVFQGWRMEKAEEMDALYKVSFKERKNAIADFGRHITGYYSFKLTTLYRTQDAPVRIKFTFGEVPSELNTPFDPYPGTLSRAWLQDEIVTITQIEQYITIPRRISFRYVKIELLGSSPDFDFAFSDMYFTATSSASGDVPELAVSALPVIREIHKVALGTLKECMQTVYEDGTKRDQRLWIGDLYLESIANIYTFKQHDLTKRCLYLLAGLAADDGRLHANVFETPEPHPQYESHCLDYSLLYNVTLLEYLKATGDMKTAADLWPVVKNQVADALSYLDDDYIFNQQKKEKPIWLFFDWRSGLDTNTPIQGLMVFALNNSYELAQMLGKEHEVKDWPVIAKKMKNIARKKLYDSKKGYFISGDQKQVSYMSQIWMILSGILSPDEGRTALKNVFDLPEAVYPGAPYGYHYLIEASIKCGLNVEAKNRLIDYWGGMVKKGADTFWEVYDPNDEYLSPYNFYPMNSYCHAWSCTPVYFIHKYPELFQRD